MRGSEAAIFYSRSSWPGLCWEWSGWCRSPSGRRIADCRLLALPRARQRGARKLNGFGGRGIVFPPRGQGR